MKKIVAWFLISSITFQLTGCYTFKEIETNNDSTYKQIVEKDIKIYLKNGNEIYSKAYYHTSNSDSSDLIIGRGTIYSPATKKSEPFGDRILRSEIDSMHFDKNYLYIWLKNKDRVNLEQSNYLEVKADSSKGLFFTDDGKLNKITFESISSIEVNEYSSTLTVLTIVGAFVLLIGIIAAASFPVFE